MAFSWTQERIERLREGRQRGETFSVIAAELGCSRNAAIGKARRLEIEAVEKPAPVVRKEPPPRKEDPRQEPRAKKRPKLQATTSGNPFKVGDRVRVNAYGIGSGMRPRRGVVTALRDILNLNGTFKRHGVAVVFDGNKTATNMAACFVEAATDDHDAEPAPRSKLGAISFTPTRRERLIASREAVERYEAAAPADDPLPDGIGIPFLNRRISQCAEILNNPSSETVMCCGEQVEHEKSSYCSKHAAKNYVRHRAAA